MTTEEMSNSLDTLLNSYNNQAQFGDQASRADIALDEYEKSLFLTQAQDAIVKSYFYANTSNNGQGFDDSERRQVDFSSLITIYKPSKSSDQSSIFDDRGIIYTLPKNLLLMLNEAFVVEGKRYVVKPISYKEYDRQMSKAYKQPLKSQCWRIFQNQNSGYDIESEIVPIQYVRNKLETENNYRTYVITPTTTVTTGFDVDESISAIKSSSTTDISWETFKENYWVNGTYSLIDIHATFDGYTLENYGWFQFTIGSVSYLIYLDATKVASSGAKLQLTGKASEVDCTYIIRYVKRPDPIILVDLPDDLTIDGVSTASACTLNPILHMDIVNEAFRLAVISKSNGAAQQQTKQS